MVDQRCKIVIGVGVVVLLLVAYVSGMRLEWGHSTTVVVQQTPSANAVTHQDVAALIAVLTSNRGAPLQSGAQPVAQPPAQASRGCTPTIVVGGQIVAVVAGLPAGTCTFLGEYIFPKARCPSLRARAEPHTPGRGEPPLPAGERRWHFVCLQ